MNMNNPNKAIEYILKHSKEYAQEKSNRCHLEEFRKVKKALLMGQSGESSVNAQERYAYAHPEYSELLLGLKSAIEIEETLKWNLTAAQLRIDVWRSESANNRFVDKAAQ